MDRIDDLWAQLHTILRTMDIPEYRFNDIHWLGRNIGVKNREHPEFDRAISLIRDISSEISKAIVALDKLTH